MQLDIMEGHLAEENEAIKQTNLVLCDRSAIDPIVYALLTASSAEEAEARRSTLVDNPVFQAVLPIYRSSASIFVLLAPVKEWLVDDGVRLMENQDKSMEMFHKVLKDLKIPYRELGPSCRSLLERMVLTMGFAKL